MNHSASTFLLFMNPIGIYAVLVAYKAYCITFTPMLFLFIIGYLAIAFEQYTGINKASIALLMGVLCWVILVFTNHSIDVQDLLQHHVAQCSEILFFLLGAMTIVELVDAHNGFDIITDKIKVTSAIKMLWLIAGITFFLSAILDNLTTSIVMISVLRKLIAQDKLRIYFAGIVVIAANAGGAWSPIGDVTTTMLWIGNQITELEIVKAVLLPSIVTLIVPLMISSFIIKDKIETPKKILDANENILPRSQQIFVLVLGISALLFVPFFKILTHLPPFLGMLFGLGVLWFVTEILHGKKQEADKQSVSVLTALQKIDTPSILFFFGILLSIGALQSAGLLTQLALQLSMLIPNPQSTVFCLGLLSSIIDNVPLVSATQGMYPLSQIPTDDFFWHFVAYCTGTGGSIFIIGSAAGIAVMGMEKIDFFTYIKRTGILALIGYIAGACVMLFCR
jgi:Na+/H+ antiporter NhaD/arsenite permease-like protein